jgi:hypothetical protein
MYESMFSLYIWAKGKNQSSAPYDPGISASTHGAKNDIGSFLDDLEVFQIQHLNSSFLGF